MRKKLAAMLLVVVMAVGLLPLSACSGGTSAATMHLRRTEGTVAVSNSDGKDVPVLDNLGLYSGYGVGTQSASYAWIDLDDVKLTKLDQNSEISIEKDGKKLDIQLKSGSLYFNVTEPLEDDETMNIRTSTMLVGIRGTCGWVEERDGLSRVYILEGKVECSAGGQTVQVSAGEYAELTADGKLVVEPFTAEDTPAFVREDADPDLIGGPDETPSPTATEPPADSESPESSESPEPSESPKPSDAPDASDTPEPAPTPTPTPAPTPEPAGGDPSSHIGLTISGGSYSNVNEPPVVMASVFDLDMGDFVEQQVSFNGCYALSPEAQLTVSYPAGADDNYDFQMIRLYVLKKYDGYDYFLDDPYYSVLTNYEGFIPQISHPESPEYGGMVQLRPGESVTFSITEYAVMRDENFNVFGTYDLLVLGLDLYDPDSGQLRLEYYGFVYG